jgi:hypothetical protein
MLKIKSMRVRPRIYTPTILRFRDRFDQRAEYPRIASMLPWAIG